MIHHESMIIANNVIRMHDTHTCVYIYIHILLQSSWLSLLIEASACITAKLTRLLDRGARSGQVFIHMCKDAGLCIGKKMFFADSLA